MVPWMPNDVAEVIETADAFSLALPPVFDLAYRPSLSGWRRIPITYIVAGAALGAATQVLPLGLFSGLIRFAAHLMLPLVLISVVAGFFNQSGSGAGLFGNSVTVRFDPRGVTIGDDRYPWTDIEDVSWEGDNDACRLRLDLRAGQRCYKFAPNANAIWYSAELIQQFGERVETARSWCKGREAREIPEEIQVLRTHRESGDPETHLDRR
jgi:hypothetical protein